MGKSEQILQVLNDIQTVIIFIKNSNKEEQNSNQLQMSSLKVRQLKIDNILFSEYQMQTAIQKSDHKVLPLSNAFRFCQLNSIYQADPLAKSTKNQMKDIISSKFLNGNNINPYAQDIKSRMLDTSKVFPINKPGNFGRILQRKCKIVPQGVLQFENQTSAQTKLKQIKSFINTIQFKSEAVNNPLSWHSQQKKYKYRIILIDNNSNSKGIYFQTKEEAQKARLYFCVIYKTKKLSNKSIQNLQQKLAQQYFSTFYNHLIYFKNKKQINGKALSKSFQKKSQKLEKNKQSFILISGSKNQPNQQQNLISSRSQNKSIKQQAKQTKKQSKQTNFVLTESVVKPQTQFKSNFQFVQQKQKMKQSQGPVYLSKIQKNKQQRGYLDQLLKIHQLNQNTKFQKLGVQQSVYGSRKTINKFNQDSLQLQILNKEYIKDVFFMWNEKSHKKKNVLYRKLFNSNNSSLKKSQFISQQEILPQLTDKMLVSKPNSALNKFDNGFMNSYFKEHDLDKQKVSDQSKLKITKKNELHVQQNRFESKSRTSRKQQSIFAYQKQQTKFKQDKNKIIRQFEYIQFLNFDTNKDTDALLFMKPIVTIKIVKRTQLKSKLSSSKIKNQYSYQILQDFLFNTILLRLHPHPQYELTSSQNMELSKIDQENFQNLSLNVEVIDFLTNKQLITCQVALDSIQLDKNLTLLMDKDHNIRLYLKNSKVDEPSKKQTHKWNGSISMHLQLPPINKDIIIKIKAFWQKQAISKSYYNMQDNFSLYDAVSNSSEQAEPLSWWLNLTELQYTYLCILQSASKILNYRLTQPMLYLIRSIIQINYKIEESVQILLSIIINFGKYYYFPQQIGQSNYLHNQLGIKGNIQFQNRVSAQLVLFKTVFKLEMPLLFDKLSTRNVQISHLMMEYTYQLFSKNFQTDKLVQIWNFSHQNSQQVPVYFFLLTISLTKHYESKLLKCKRLKQVVEIFQSKQIDSLHSIKRYVLDLIKKYFSQSKNFFQGLKQAFKQKPLQRFAQFFLKRNIQNKQIIKSERILIKKQYCKSLINSNQALFQQEQNFSLENVQRKYALHIYFYKLPEQSGSLTLRQSNSEYQCIGYQKNRYFIIGEVKNQIVIRFVDLKGNEYKNVLLLNLGVNQFRLKLKCDKIKNKIQIQYLAGLLTDIQIQIFKTNKKITHFLGPYIQKQSVNQQMLRSVNQIRYMISQNNIKTQQSLVNFKALFGFGQKQFNQIQFYIYKICCKSTTLIQKIVQIQKLSTYASKKLYLCDNKAIFKILMQNFLKINQFQIKQSQFYSYFDDSLQSEFDAPKILKCRFFHSDKQLKLQKALIKYQSERGFKYLYEDIIFQDVLTFIKPLLFQSFGTLVQGDLKILYSTSGQVQMKNLKLILQGKQLVIDDHNTGNIFQNSIFHDISQKQPEILMTEVLPSFTKISTILDYVNTKKNVDLRLKSQDSQKKVIPEDINLLKYCQKKFKQCILLRYQSCPTTKLYIPFLSYFYELTTQIKPLKFKFNYLNNVRDSIKSICTLKSNLKYSESHKDQEQLDFLPELGLYGNLRKFANHKSQTVYFWTHNKDQYLSVKDSLVNINYGYGIYRWQKCKIRQYRRISKIRHGQGKNTQSQPNTKIQYLIQYKDKLFFGRDYEVRIDQKVKQQLIQIQVNQNQRIQTLQKSDIVTGLKHLIGFLGKNV